MLHFYHWVLSAVPLLSPASVIERCGDRSSVRARLGVMRVLHFWSAGVAFCSGLLRIFNKSWIGGIELENFDVVLIPSFHVLACFNVALTSLVRLTSLIWFRLNFLECPFNVELSALTQLSAFNPAAPMLTNPRHPHTPIYTAICVLIGLPFVSPAA